VTYFVTYPPKNMAIDHQLRPSIAVKSLPFVARKSLIFFIFVAHRVTRWIIGGAAVNRRVAGSSPA
jgi:hypothetical protein